MKNKKNTFPLTEMTDFLPQSAEKIESELNMNNNIHNTPNKTSYFKAQKLLNNLNKN